MSARKRKPELSALVEKYRRYSVVSEIEKNLSSRARLLYPTGSLYLSDLYDEKNYDLSCYPELSESLRKDGFLTPLVIVKGKKEGTFEIINGVKRFLLAEKDGMKEVPCVLADLSADRKNAYILENILEEGDCALVKTECFERLKENAGYPESRIAQEASLSLTEVRNLLRLRNLPPFLKEGIRNFTLRETEARALLGMPEETQRKLYSEIKDGKLSVRDIEKIKRDFLGKKRKTSVSRKGRRIEIVFKDEEEAERNYPKIVREFSD
jgi:ParB family chromosome partitioning protein